MIILDGKKINSEIASTLREAISLLEQKPTLLIIQVGHNSASDIYIKKKIEFGQKIGAQTILKNFPEEVEQKTITDFIEENNMNSRINGILVQLPIPKHLSQTEILDTVSTKKDVDGISSENLLRLKNKGQKHFVPVPVRGVLTLLQKNDIEIKGKKVVIINDSNLIGKPISIILSDMGADVVICNEKTENIPEITKTADILITAIGKPEIIDDSYLKEGQTIVDIGISRTDNGLFGDVKKEISTELFARTPVPGGVGPMTVASLFENLLQAFKMQQK